MKKILNDKFNRRKLKIRNKISGVPAKPRLSVFRSNKFIYGQLIDDLSGTTLFSISTKDVKSGNKVSSSFEAGKVLANKLISSGVDRAVFDRNGYKYHGRIKSFADGAREGGLKI